VDRPACSRSCETRLPMPRNLSIFGLKPSNRLIQVHRITLTGSLSSTSKDSRSHSSCHPDRAFWKQWETPVTRFLRRVRTDGAEPVRHPFGMGSSNTVTLFFLTMSVILVPQWWSALVVLNRMCSFLTS